ncbi:uncharacterized protein FFB14_00115 [Fusarium fujikuroi]|nr:uncharacterized protein FFB14_00115 [Fusarium fujikuroi]
MTSGQEQVMEEAIPDLSLERTIVQLTLMRSMMTFPTLCQSSAFETNDPECLPGSDEFPILFSTRNRFDDPTDLQNLLSDLVIIPDGDNPYRAFPSFAHSTVLKYLMSPRVSPAKFHLDRPDATWFILKGSWAYMNGRLLINAAGAGESRIVELLLDMKPIEEHLWYLDSTLRTPSIKLTDVFKPYKNIIAGGENMTVLTELLEAGANVKGVGSSGNAAIHLAATHGHLDIVTFLTEHKGVHLDSPNGKGETPLLLAFMHSRTAVVALLLGLSGSDSHRADEGGRTPLSWAATRSNKVLFDLLHQDQNVDVNKDDCHGRTPLIWAAIAGQQDLIKSLLSDPRIEPDARDHSVRTAVSWAAFGGYYHPVQTLWLDNRVTKYPCDYEGRDLLSYACDQGHESLARDLLLAADLDINRPDYYQRTPLIWARLQRYSQIERLLLDDPRVLELDPESTPALSTAGIQLPDEYIWDRPMTPLACTKVTGKGDASASFPSNGMSISRKSTVDGVGSEIWTLEFSPDGCGPAEIFQARQWSGFFTLCLDAR